MCARAPRGVRPGCEVVHLDTGGVELGPEVLQHPQVRHQRREELRRHPGVESHLAGLVIGILKDFQCNDSLTGAVCIMESSRAFPNFIYWQVGNLNNLG